MPLDQLLINLIPVIPWILFKLLALALLLLHVAFSAVLLRQTKLMITVVEAKISPTIYAITIIHLLFSIFLFLWTIFFL